MIAAVVVAATLTKPQYQALLDRANARVSRAEAAAQKGLTPKATQVEAARLVRVMARAETLNARMFAAATPPRVVAGVNGQITRAERLFARELLQVAVQVEQAPTHAAAARILHGPGPKAGPRLLDRAIARLHALGYR